MQLMPGLHMIASGERGPAYSDDYDCNCFLWEYARGEFALFDAGAGRNVPELLKRLDDVTGNLQRVRYLFLTHHHADHIGGAARLRQATGAQTAASLHSAVLIAGGDEDGIGLAAARTVGGYPADYRIEACPVDLITAEGEEWLLGKHRLQVISTPGHCRGSLSFYWKMHGKRMLVSGDVVFPGGAISLLNLADCSLSEYAETIAKLDALRLDVLLPGHVGTLMDGAYAHVREANEEFRRLRIPISYYHSNNTIRRNIK